MSKYALVGTMLLGLIASVASASVLTFDILNQEDYAPLSQDYGDRITSTTMGSFSYGSEGGYTPNIGVTYTGLAGSHLDPPLDLGSNLSVWADWSYHETNVLNNEDDGEGYLRIDFTADPGYLVNLHSFDLTGYYTGYDNGTDPLYTYMVDDLWIRDQNSALLSEADILINDPLAPITYEGVVYSGKQISITLNLASLGTENDSVGLDNIEFSQSVAPEPATMSLLAIGGIALIRRRRRA